MLKPVIDLIQLLEVTFIEGECTCTRCSSGENQEEYGYAHNFMINGQPHRRQFAKSGKDDLSAKVKAALKATHKGDEEFKFQSPTAEEKITDMLEPDLYNLFLLLGKDTGFISKVTDEKIHFDLT